MEYISEQSEKINNMKEIINIKQINIDDLNISQLNVRKINDIESIQNLADNIKKNGLLNPLTVIFNKILNKYDIIAGQRRYHALKKNNMVSVSCNILNETMSEQEQVSMSLIENVQRVNMSLCERVKTYKKLHIQYNNDSTKLSKLINISKATIDKYLKISHLPDKILDRLDATNNDKISLDYAVDLAKLNILGEDSEEKLEKIINLINDVSRDDRNELRKCIINDEKYNGCDFDTYFKKLVGKKKEYLTNKERLDREKEEEFKKFQKYEAEQIAKEAAKRMAEEEAKRMAEEAEAVRRKEEASKIKPEIKADENIDSDSFDDSDSSDSSDNSDNSDREEEKIQNKIKSELSKNKNSPYIIPTNKIRNPILQNYYREGLINRYKKCIISGMHMEVCEACHIIPFSESENFDINNGILLNSVLHKLFDKHYWSINPSTLCVEISNKCNDFEFLQEYNNKCIDILNQYDDTKHNLRNHYDIFILKQKNIDV
jgi:ParB/RepB/Spo0J family partition protein